MNGQQHTIKKFSLELQTRGRAHSYALQRKCIKMVNESLVEGMDELLSTRFPEDEIIRINKIEIDLGNLTIEELEKDFIVKCMAAFTRSIQKISAPKKKEGEQEISLVSKDESIIERFVLFLSSGKMYWAAANMDFSKWQTVIAEAIKKNPAFLTHQLDEALKNTVTIERLAAQFEDAFIQLLVQLYQPHINTEFENVMRLLQNISSQNNYSAARKNILLKLLPLLFKPQAIVSKISFDSVMEEVAATSKNIAPDISLQLKETTLTLFQQLKTAAGIKLKDELINEKLTPAIWTDKKNQDNQERRKNIETTENGIYISNAGLVILHPFLQNFFTATHLMKGENFNNDTGVQTAVHLLQYLVNGEQQLPEYIMPLNKILCGINEEQHIDRFIQLEEIQLKEAGVLLEGVIAHWEILKNTSVEGLQETFFQRRGKLVFNATDGFWKLQVERKALDILLDKIPWGISYIKLPWMKYPLVTEW
jgi:hypothetical protein